MSTTQIEAEPATGQSAESAIDETADTSSADASSADASSADASSADGHVAESDEQDSGHEVSDAVLDQVTSSDGVADDPASQHERRTSERRRFPRIQPVAACDGARPPTLDMFADVRCYDISNGGISFLWPQKPEFEYAVIGLGTVSERIWLKTRLVRQFPIEGLDGEFLACCQFIGRISMD